MKHLFFYIVVLLTDTHTYWIELRFVLRWLLYFKDTILTYGRIKISNMGTNGEFVSVFTSLRITNSTKELRARTEGGGGSYNRYNIKWFTVYTICFGVKIAPHSVHTVNLCIPHDSDSTGYFPTQHQLVGLCNYSAVFSVMYKLNSSLLHVFTQTSGSRCLKY